MMIFIPVMLLLLYPLSCFHKCLNCCHLRCLALHTFADAFQGCYKDGTNGTRDCRWFSVVHLLMRFGIVAAYDMTKYYNICCVFMLLWCLFYLVVAAILVPPYKDKQHVKIDMLLFLALSMWVTSSILMIIYVPLEMDLILVCLNIWCSDSVCLLHWVHALLTAGGEKVVQKDYLALYLEQQNYYPLN